MCKKPQTSDMYFLVQMSKILLSMNICSVPLNCFKDRQVTLSFLKLEELGIHSSKDHKSQGRRYKEDMYIP